MPRSESYHAYLIERLRNPEEAEAYLKAVLEENDQVLLQKAIRNVIEAGNNSVVISLASDTGKLTASERVLINQNT